MKSLEEKDELFNLFFSMEEQTSGYKECHKSLKG